MSEYINLIYGKDYNYIVESFYCEYKLDKQTLKSIVNQYRMSDDRDEQIELIQEFHRLYPEYKSNDIKSVNIDHIPDTITKKIYFVQSPKGDDGLPTIHYSLKEKMLSDFRAKRSSVKKDLAKAEHTGDKIGAIRFNAKQLAIKVVCNSEYGASNNEYFAHYDPDIAAAVTFAARQLIRFLTNNLETDTLYIDSKFLKQNEKEIKNLESIGCLSIKPYADDKNALFSKRRHVLRRIFDDNYNVITDDILEVNIKKSTVVYQDTDSNYYMNKYIMNYFMSGKNDSYICSPEIIDKCMHRMLDHNNLIANFAKDTVQRRPVGLGFEGSFIICRYLNRKKKYYGIKWSEDGFMIPSDKIPNPNAYDEDNILKLDYSPYWIPKKTVLPQPNGEYIRLDNDLLLRQGVNYLDYVHDYNVKCTGVDLARRDQYKFINFFHVMILQKDLRLMSYDGNNKWSIFKKNEPMQSIIENIIDTFREIITTYTDIALFKTDKKPSIEFKITDFAKNSAYRKGKHNAVSTIVLRLESQHKEKYIPVIGERMSYVVILDSKTEEERMLGKNSSGNIAPRSYVIDEIMDNLKSECSEEDFNTKLSETNLNISYEDWLNAKAISILDFKYYLECLCKSTALYIVGDLYPEEIKQIDDGSISQSEANKLITKLQGIIASNYVKKYFHYGRSVMTAYNRAEKEIKSFITHQPNDVNLLYLVYKDLNKSESLTLKHKNRILEDTTKNIERYNNVIEIMNKIYKTLSTSNFIKYKPKTNGEANIYEKYKHDLPGLLDQIVICSKKLAIYNKIKSIAEELRFN